MDFLISLCAIVFLSPLLLVMIILISVKLGRPVLFKQQRPGYKEKIFTLYKFRTMTNEKNVNGDLLPDSVRLTKFGKFVRSTSLDELPELFNVLKGDMSIIGPRPLLIRYLPFYSEQEKQRHNVRPGISGLAQISGRNNLDWNKRLALDVKYANNINFCLDLKIIFLTFIKVIKRDDITVVDQAYLQDLDYERSDIIDFKRTTM
jgi:lipopolysaccharide/colanic/teichoic acid biosynthesis glycosyltransferase